MAKKRKRGKRKFTIPLAPLVGLLIPAQRAIGDAMAGNFPRAISSLGYDMFGVHKKGIDFGQTVRGLSPVIMGLLVHKFVGGPPLNLNRMLANAGVPIIRI